MIEPRWMIAASLIFHFLVQVLLVVQVILRPHRDPSSRIAWVVVIVTLPVIGIFGYFFLGEINIGRRRIARMGSVVKLLPRASDIPGMEVKEIQPALSGDYGGLFRIAQSVNGFSPIGGNRAELAANSNAAIRSIISDIDAAKHHVHVNFYIWLPDNNGTRLALALERAARRGVACRVMADGLGSRTMINSSHWQSMQSAGVHTAVALPIGTAPWSPIFTRVDLRNHRKIVVIDNGITYCGSQNCADPEFRIKPRYAPWVDLMIRFEGPIARQNQLLFAADWMAHVDEDLRGIVMEQISSFDRGFTAVAIGTGPTVRYSAMPEMFESLMYAAKEELFITTPYYVPDEAMQAALCASGRRGVATTLIVPAKNDSWIVKAASHSYYADLLDAGVRIFEYEGGLLHTKSVTIDGEVSLIGSANLDRRSFELNYENNILLHDPDLTARIRERQLSYRWQSVEVSAEMVRKWPIRQRLVNNTIAMLGPVL
ncbi:MAG: cardiolipin synthase [Planctomycetota bacterium]|jgi:cardiolipin synthase